MLICKAVRLTTGSVVYLTIPPEVGETDAVEWVGKELNWQFVPFLFKRIDDGDVNPYQQTT